MNLNELFDAAQKDLKLNGFVGMDYNMAVICIIAKKLNKRVNFMFGGSSYESKLDYWARKRDFGHLQVSSEDELLEHAWNKIK